jgi:hypothetical protein
VARSQKAGRSTPSIVGEIAIPKRNPNACHRGIPKRLEFLPGFNFGAIDHTDSASWHELQSRRSEYSSAKRRLRSERRAFDGFFDLLTQLQRDNQLCRARMTQPEAKRPPANTLFPRGMRQRGQAILAREDQTHVNDQSARS